MDNVYQLIIELTLQLNSFLNCVCQRESATARSISTRPQERRKAHRRKMSSGFGFKGREGRCYRFWKDVEECSVCPLLCVYMCLCVSV